MKKLVLTMLIVMIAGSLHAKSDKKEDKIKKELGSQSQSESPDEDDNEEQEARDSRRRKWDGIPFFQMSTGGGLSAVIADTSMKNGVYEPEDEIQDGYQIDFHMYFNFSNRFTLRTGTELVSRRVRQDYDYGFIFVFSDNGETEYRFLHLDIPVYAHFNIHPRHSLFLGPKLAIKLHDRCKSDVVDLTKGVRCQDVNDIFVPLAGGYQLKFNDKVGLDFFLELALTPMVDTSAIKSRVSRTGVNFRFYF